MMIKKTFFMFIVVCNVLFYMSIGNSFADDRSDYSGYWEAGDYAKVLEVTSTAISGQPGAALWAHNYRARAAFELGDHAAVDASCQKLLSEYSDQKNAIWVLNEIAHNYQKAGQKDKARALYEKIIEKTPAENSYLLRTYWYLGDHAKVVELASEVIDSDPEAAVFAHSYKARAAFKLGDYATAEAGCRELLKYNNEKDAIWCVNEIATYYMKAGRKDDAMSLYLSMVEQAGDNPETMRAYSWLAKDDVTRGDLEAADAKCQKMLTDFYNHSGLDRCIDRVAREYFNKNKFMTARSLSQEVIERCPGRALRGHINNALAAYKLGDYADAEASCQALIDNYGDEDYAAAGVQQIGTYYMRDREYEKAREKYLVVIATWPGSPKATKAQAGVAKSYVLQNDNVSAENSVDEFMANRVDQPDNDKNTGSAAGVAMSYMWLGDEAQVCATVDEMRRNFSGDPNELEFHIRRIKEAYYGRARAAIRRGGEGVVDEVYEQAVPTLMYIDEGFDLDEYELQFNLFVADFYNYDLNDPGKSLEYSRKALALQPEAELAARLQYRIGQRIRQLGRAGEMPKEEAESEMLAAFRTVVDKYPDSRWAGYARNNIEQYEKVEQQPEEEETE